VVALSQWIGMLRKGTACLAANGTNSTTRIPLASKT
jgi:hypothetical protein